MENIRKQPGAIGGAVPGQLALEFDGAPMETNAERDGMSNVRPILERYPSLAAHQSYEVGSTRHRLVSALNEAWAKGNIPLSAKKSSKINRKHFANLLGFTAGAMVSYKGIFDDYEIIVQPDKLREFQINFNVDLSCAGEQTELTSYILKRFPELTTHQSYSRRRGEFAKAKLVLALNACIRKGEIPRSRLDRSKISISFFAVLLGYTTKAFDNYKDILLDYETILEYVEPTTPVQDKGQFGESPARDGTLNSVAQEICAQFPKLLKHQFYTATATSKSKMQLVNALNDCVYNATVPRMRKDSARINYSHFAAMLGVSPGNMYYYKDILEDYESILEFVEPVASVQTKNDPFERFKNNEPLNDVARFVVGRFPNLIKHQYYGPARGRLTRAKLVDALNQCICNGNIPRARVDKAKIDKAYFAKLLEIDNATINNYNYIFKDYELIIEEVHTIALIEDKPKSDTAVGTSEGLSDDARWVVGRYSSLLKHQFYPEGSNARKIVLILNKQFKDNNIDRARGGKLNRASLARQIGIQKSAMNHYMGIIFDYENAAGSTMSATEGRLPAMRSWLESSIRSGTLDIRNGKISRVQLSEEFGIVVYDAAANYPKVEALISEFDQRVRSSGYQPNFVVGKIKELEALLLNEPPIDQSGRAINRTEVSKRLGLPVRSVKSPPYSEIIDRADEALLKGLSRDPLVAHCGGRFFKFHEMVVEGWSDKYVIRLTGAFRRIYKKKSANAAQTAYRAILDLFCFISKDHSSASRAIVAGLCADVSPRALIREFTEVTQAYRDYVRSRYERDSTCNVKISATNAAILQLSSQDICPNLALKLIHFREDNKSHLKSLVEASSNSKNNRGSDVDDYIEFAMAMLKQAADLHEIDLDPMETGEFFNVLRVEIARGESSDQDTPATVIRKILNRRIELIKSASWACVQVGMRNLRIGKELLIKGVDLGEDFDQIANSRDTTRTKRNELVRKYFPMPPEDRGTANLIRLVADRYGYLFPTAEGSRDFKQFFQRRAFEYGGVILLQSYLTPLVSAVAAVLTLYLLESGSNISVGRTLYLRGLRPAEEPHHSKITGYKGRASYRPIFATLDDKGYAVRAIKWLESAVECIPGLGPEANRELMVCKGPHERFRTITGNQYRDEFKRLIRTIPELSSLAITPNMIRPSLLLWARLQSDGRTRLSMALGQHGPGVHEGYTSKPPLWYEFDSETRDFQNSFEAIVIHSIDQAHDVLGIDAEEFASRVSLVMKTGLGVFCRDRFGRPGNDGEICTTLDCWRKCPQLIIIAKKEEMAILQLWQHSLRQFEGQWVRDHPERWGRVWLPWLTFIDHVEIKMIESFGAIWRAASLISQGMINSLDFRSMRPF